VPDWKAETKRRLANLKLEPTSEAAILEELSQDLADCYAESLSSGATEAEAYQRTLAELSGSELLAYELCGRERPSNLESIVLGTNRRTNMLADLWQDLRYGARMLLKQPGFTLIAVLTLALGIGANTAIFSVVYGVLLKPLPYKDAERIVVASVSPPDFRDLKAASRSFDSISLWGRNMYNVGIGDETAQVRGAIVTPELLPQLTQPALGRFWQADEDMQPLVVISHDFWQNQFGGDPQVIGRTLRLYGKPYTIVGVTPPEFQYPSREFKIWNTFGLAMTETQQQLENRQFRSFRAVAHLKPGVSFEQMQAEIETISQRLQRQYPDTNAGVRISFAPLYERLVGDVSRALWVLLTVVGLVLLIACANIANLTLARLAARERELAIRASLGAERGRLLRQLLTESLLLAALGGALGALLAFWGLDALVSFNPADLPRLSEVRLNAPVLLFTLGATAGAGLLCGLASAWQVARGNMNQMLRDGGRGALGQAQGKRLRGALVIAEVALSLIVLTGAGLLLKSFHRMLNVDAGFKAENLLTVNLGLAQIKDIGRRVSALRDALARVAQTPGVQTASSGSALPPINAQRATRFAVLDGTEKYNNIAYLIAISPDYFRALGTPVRAGREFNERDGAKAAKAVIINEHLARTWFPNESALGKRLQIINSEHTNEWREIVGVVANVRYSGLDDATTATIYTPFAQTPFLWSNLMIRTAVPPATMIPSVRQAIKAADPTLEPASFRPLAELVSESVAQPRFYTFLLGAFAVLALALAAVGIYGVLAYAVTQRTREIGLRLALGAGRGAALRMVLRQGMSLTLTGVALGLIGAWAMTRLLETMLFEVSATDPVTFTGVALLLALVALLACWIPARRATKVDPLIALRSE
jgi:putative ABC transport system permease protein